MELLGHAGKRMIPLKEPVVFRIAGIEIPFDSALTIKPNGQTFAIMHGVPVPNGHIPHISCTGALIAVPINPLLPKRDAEDIVLEIRNTVSNRENCAQKSILIAEKTGMILTIPKNKFGQKMSDALKILDKSRIVAGSREPFHREHERLTPIIPYATLYKVSFATTLAQMFLDKIVHPDEIMIS